MNTSTPHAFALFSGGLDSILAARLIMEQGLVVRCLHFVTPFFGKPQLIPHWEKVYGLEVEAVDVGEAFVRLLRERPAHGFGKVMNPCVDCKILMMRKARELMKKSAATQRLRSPSSVRSAPNCSIRPPLKSRAWWIATSCSVSSGAAGSPKWRWPIKWA